MVARENMPLIVKYRPRTFKEVVGHADILNALSRRIRDPDRPHSYLLTGGTGIGKTTLARIIAAKVKAEVVEIDAASHSGIDDMRELINIASHRSMMGTGLRMFIIDEAHGLSKNAWQAILKLVEEPPEHLYIALATTELSKVPATIVGRCYHVALRNLKDTEIEALVLQVAEWENWRLSGDVVNAVVQAAEGSPRNALSILDAVHDCEDREEVQRIIRLQTPSDDIITLSRLLLSSKPSWLAVQRILATLDDAAVDECAIPIGRYMAKVMKTAKNEQEAKRAWEVLNALHFPTETFDPRGKIYTQLGRVIFG